MTDIMMSILFVFIIFGIDVVFFKGFLARRFQRFWRMKRNDKPEPRYAHIVWQQDDLRITKVDNKLHFERLREGNWLQESVKTFLPKLTPPARDIVVYQDKERTITLRPDWSLHYREIEGYDSMGGPIISESVFSIIQCSSRYQIRYHKEYLATQF